MIRQSRWASHPSWFHLAPITWTEHHVFISGIAQAVCRVRCLANCDRTSTASAPAVTPAASRRATLYSAAAFVCLAAQGEGAANADVEFKTATNGLQFYDEVEGTGPSPVKGARIR